jgi:hypothetical protein
MLMAGLAVLAISPALAATERCRSIRSDKERLACFDSEASAAQASKPHAKSTKGADGSTFVDPVESLKAENDKVGARLKGICRGC